MASKGNTWFKKLKTKGKANAMKMALGNEVGVMNYCSKAKSATSRALNRETIDDKPLPGGVTYKEKKALPRVAGWKPEPYQPKLNAKPLNTSYGTRGEGAWR